MSPVIRAGHLPELLVEFQAFSQGSSPAAVHNDVSRDPDDQQCDQKRNPNRFPRQAPRPVPVDHSLERTVGSQSQDLKATSRLRAALELLSEWRRDHQFVVNSRGISLGPTQAPIASLYIGMEVTGQKGFDSRIVDDVTLPDITHGFVVDKPSGIRMPALGAAGELLSNLCHLQIGIIDLWDVVQKVE